MDYNEFAEKIKIKYPQYKDMDNKDLAQRMVAKYPNTYDVSFDEVQEPIKASATKIDIRPSRAIKAVPKAIGAVTIGRKKNIPYKEAYKLADEAYNQLEQEHPILVGGVPKAVDFGAALALPMTKVKALGSLGNMALSGLYQGGVIGGLNSLAERGDLSGAGQGAALGAGLGGAIGAVPYVGRAAQPIVQNIKKNVYQSPVYRNTVGALAENLANIPKKYWNLAYDDILNNGGKLLREEVGENPYAKGTEMYRNAIDKVNQASGYNKTIYKNLGQRAKEKFEKSIIPDSVINNKYKELGQQSLNKIKAYESQLGNEVQEALNKLPEDFSYPTNVLKDDVEKIYNQYSLSGNQDLNVARNEGARAYNDIMELIDGSQAERQRAFEEVIENAKQGRRALPDVTNHRYKNRFYKKVWATENNAVEEAARRYDDEILREIKNNPEILNDVQEIEKLEKKIASFRAPTGFEEELYKNLYKTIDDASTALAPKQRITPKELYDINRNISAKTQWDNPNAKIQNDILEQIYGKYAGRLGDISKDLKNANQGYSNLMNLEKETGGLNPTTIGNKLREYQSGGQIRSGVSEAFDNLDKTLPDDLKFLQEAKKLNNLRIGQEQLQKDLGSGIFNDISRYERAPFETQDALAKIAPNELAQYQALKRFQDEQNQILAPNILPKSLRKNAAPLVDKTDALTQNAVDYLQNRTGVNFIDELERARAKDILNMDYYSSGGGFGGSQGFKNYAVNEALNALPIGAKQIAKAKGKSVKTYRKILDDINDVINPVSVGRKTKKKSKNIGRYITPAAVEMMPLQGYVSYEDYGQ